MTETPIEDALQRLVAECWPDASAEEIAALRLAFFRGVEEFLALLMDTDLDAMSSAVEELADFFDDGGSEEVH